MEWTWERVWHHVKEQRPNWRLTPPMGVVQPDGGRLLLLLRHGGAAAGELRPLLVYLEADGSFVDVVREEPMTGRVELTDGRIFG
jgi:hypothetical protein